MCVSAPPSSSLSAKQKQQKTQPPSSFLLPRSFVHTLRIYLLSCSYRPNTISCSLYAKKKTFLLFGSPIATTYNNNNNNTTTTNMETNAFFGGLTKKNLEHGPLGERGPGGRCSGTFCSRKMASRKRLNDWVAEGSLRERRNGQYGPCCFFFSLHLSLSLSISTLVLFGAHQFFYSSNFYFFAYFLLSSLLLLLLLLPTLTSSSWRPNKNFP